MSSGDASADKLRRFMLGARVEGAVPVMIRTTPALLLASDKGFAVLFFKRRSLRSLLERVLSPGSEYAGYVLDAFSLVVELSKLPPSDLMREILNREPMGRPYFIEEKKSYLVEREMVRYVEFKRMFGRRAIAMDVHLVDGGRKRYGLIYGIDGISEGEALGNAVKLIKGMGVSVEASETLVAGKTPVAEQQPGLRRFILGISLVGTGLFLLAKILEQCFQRIQGARDIWEAVFSLPLSRKHWEPAVAFISIVMIILGKFFIEEFMKSRRKT